MNINTILYLSAMSIEDLAYKIGFEKYIDAKVDIDKACNELKICTPLTKEGAWRIYLYLQRGIKK